MNSIRKLESIFISAILILSTFALAIPVITPASAAEISGTYMTVSSDYLGKYNILLVKIVDREIKGNPNITIYQGTTPIGQYMLNSTAISYEYALFFVYKNLTYPSTITYDGGAITLVELNNSKNVINLPKMGGDNLTITYLERPREFASIFIKESTVSFESVDRTTIPPGAVIKMNVKDPTANYNVTAKDFCNGTAASTTIGNNWYNITIQVFGPPRPTVYTYLDGQNSTDTTAGCISETGVNTGTYTITLELGELFTGTNALKDGDTVRLNITDPDGGLIVKDFTVDVTDASTVAASATTVDFSSPVTITVVDFDRNNDTTVKESIPVYVNVSSTDIKTAGITWFNLTETGVNTHTFTGKIYVDLTAGVSKAENVSDGLRLLVNESLARELPAFKITYSDILYVTKQNQSVTVALSPAKPTVSFEQSQYGFTGTARAVLTLPTANDNPSVSEVLNLTIPSTNTTGILNHTAPSVAIGNFTLYVKKKGGEWITVYLNGSSKPGAEWNYSECVLNGTLIPESAADSGIFYLSINLTALNLSTAFGSGAVLNITYNDYFSGKTVNDTTIIGGTYVGTIELDRTEYPIVLDNVRVHVTVTDQDLNTKPLDRETWPNKVYVWFISAVDGSLISPTTLGLPETINLTETGKNTGVFTGIYNLNYSAMGVPWQIIGGKIKVSYAEPLAPGGWVTDTADLVAHTATLSTNVTSVNIGEGIKITLNEPDRNLDKYENDTVTIYYKIGAFYYWPPITLVETNVNTGVFEAELTVGSKDLPVSAGETFTLSFTDIGTALSHFTTGLASESLTVTVNVPSHTATITLDKSEYGPYSTVYVNVTDPDSRLEDSLTIQVKSSMLTTPIYVKSWNRTDSTFRFNFTLRLNTNVSAVDTIYVYYTDPVDVTGATKTLSATASVRCSTGSITFDKTYYKAGEYMTVNITDSDRNTDSSKVEVIYALINSTSYPPGNTVPLIETGSDTGVFSTRIYLKSTGVPSGTEMLVSTGDTVEAVYWDPHDETGKARYVTATATIGVPAPTYPVPASTPGMLDSNFKAITNVSAGAQVYINATFKNEAAVSKYAVVFVQVLDAKGHPIFFTYHIYPSLAAGQSTSVLDAWTPTTAGTYTIRILVTDALVGGKAISEPVETTFTVV